MYYNRIIPCLLLEKKGLVKTIKFKHENYIGDPLNAVKIFNEKEVDELIFLDITATADKREPEYEYIKKISEQCFMPLCYGGGINSVNQIRKIFEMGFEKVSINTSCFCNPLMVKEAISIFGTQSIVGAMDVRKTILGKNIVVLNRGKKNIHKDPVEYARYLEQLGVGEILLNCITEDGCMKGYDYELVKAISNAVNVPLAVCGGAGSLEDCGRVIRYGASAAVAGSLFVYWGSNKAVLINYPERKDINCVIKSDEGDNCKRHDENM